VIGRRRANAENVTTRRLPFQFFLSKLPRTKVKHGYDSLKGTSINASARKDEGLLQQHDANYQVHLELLAILSVADGCFNTKIEDAQGNMKVHGGRPRCCVCLVTLKNNATPSSRVAPGDYNPGALVEPYLEISTIRLSHNSCCKACTE
jgi:hypothetical protein